MKSQSTPTYNFEEVQEIKRQALKELKRQMISSLVAGLLVGLVIGHIATLIWIANMLGI
jgi:hypothetical protein